MSRCTQEAGRCSVWWIRNERGYGAGLGGCFAPLARIRGTEEEEIDICPQWQKSSCEARVLVGCMGGERGHSLSSAPASLLPSLPHGNIARTGCMPSVWQRGDLGGHFWPPPSTSRLDFSLSFAAGHMPDVKFMFPVGHLEREGSPCSHLPLRRLAPGHSGCDPSAREAISVGKITWDHKTRITEGLGLGEVSGHSFYKSTGPWQLWLSHPRLPRWGSGHNLKFID